MESARALALILRRHIDQIVKHLVDHVRSGNLVKICIRREGSLTLSARDLFTMPPEAVIFDIDPVIVRLNLEGAFAPFVSGVSASTKGFGAPQAGHVGSRRPSLMAFLLRHSEDRAGFNTAAMVL